MLQTKVTILDHCGRGSVTTEDKDMPLFGNPAFYVVGLRNENLKLAWAKRFNTLE
jgi:hypothetical protein